MVRNRDRQGKKKIRTREEKVNEFGPEVEVRGHLRIRAILGTGQNRRGDRERERERERERARRFDNR